MDILLRHDSPKYDPVTAYEQVKATFIDKMPGKRD